MKDSFIVAKKTNATDTNYGSWNSYLGSKAGKNNSTDRLDYVLTNGGFTVEEYQIGDGYATYLRDNNGVDELAFFEEDILAALAGTLNASLRVRFGIRTIFIFLPLIYQDFRVNAQQVLQLNLPRASHRFHISLCT